MRDHPADTFFGPQPRPCVSSSISARKNVIGNPIVKLWRYPEKKESRLENPVQVPNKGADWGSP